MYKFTLPFLFLFLITYGQESNKDTTIIIKSYSERWELDKTEKKGTFRLISYKPIYLTFGRISSNPNKQPKSENPDYSASEKLPYNNTEAKFQLSFKTKVAQDLFWGKGDIWLAYTQKAHWQIYNTKISRAFRELNYEPELIFKYPMRFNFMGGQFKSIGFTLNHQSNGKNLPLSRSWNRIIFHTGFEINNWIITVNPWIRLADDEDENPDITKYIGNGELNVAYTYNNHQFYTLITHPFSTFKGGSIQLNYIFPIKGLLRGHMQLFEGYGETMIDYNHKQTTLGIGISFTDW